MIPYGIQYLHNPTVVIRAPSLQHIQVHLPVSFRSPLIIESSILLDPGATTVLQYDIQAKYLPLHEYAYDSERGITISGAWFRVRNDSEPTTRHGDMHSPHMQFMLPLPDASMSKNVLCISLTAIALLVIPLLRMLFKPPRPA